MLVCGGKPVEIHVLPYWARNISDHNEPPPSGKRLRQLTLVALGVVYGDIGTSPLYALRECFKKEYGISPTPDNVYGVLSLVVWALILVVTVKYLIFILRADNRGEGGVLALLALILQQQRRDGDKLRKQIIVGLGLVGAALLYGDGVITPAISVLGAMEGLEVITPKLRLVVVPFTLAILLGLFLVQKKGTTKVGRIFGPVMMVWFVTIAALGIYEVSLAPEILAAVNPLYAVPVLPYARQAGIRPAWRGSPGSDRWRSSLRGHGALRPTANSNGLVLSGPPGIAAELLRAGRSHSPRTRCR